MSGNIPTPRTRHTHKDTVFRDLFGSPERKANALSLYNALSGSHYEDPDELELTTLDDAIYMHVKNDVSFLIGDELVLWEHQSTPNPNMPLRGLHYLSALYAAYVDKNELDPYGSSIVRLPRPRYFVFYIGEPERPQVETLRLSDAFAGSSHEDDALEVLATVYNINEGANPELAAACEPLAGYSHLVALIRAGRHNGLDANRAVDGAVRRCIEEGVLADYLAPKRAEVAEMFLYEFDEELHDRTLRAEGRAEGLAEGRAEGKAEGRSEEHSRMLEQTASLIANGRICMDAAMELGFSKEELEARLAVLSVPQPLA